MVIALPFIVGALALLGTSSFKLLLNPDPKSLDLVGSQTLATHLFSCWQLAIS